MKNTPKSFYILTLIMGIVGCSPKSSYCDLPEINRALKNVLILDMKDWQKNAQYSGIENFETQVSQVVEEVEIMETRFIGGNDFRLTEVPDAGSCRCRSKIRFKDHEQYKESIEGPVAKVKAEEHPMNSAYLRLEEQMNYLNNDGFVFSYVVVKKENEPLKVIQLYPIVTETTVDDAGKLLFDYIDVRDSQ